MELRYVTRQVSNGREGTDKILQYRNEDKWVDGSTTANGVWVHGEWKDVPILALGEEHD